MTDSVKGLLRGPRKRLLTRLVIGLVGVEIVYLCAVNLMLNLAWTQTNLNLIRPQRLAISWERAWTLHPFRVHFTGLTLNGQTWSQQYQISTPQASASLALTPLFARTLHLSGLQTGDLDVRVRPKLRSDRDDAPHRPFYPVIDGRNPDASADPRPERRPGWQLVFDIAKAAGHLATGRPAGERIRRCRSRR